MSDGVRRATVVAGCARCHALIYAGGGPWRTLHPAPGRDRPADLETCAAGPGGHTPATPPADLAADAAGLPR